MCSTTIYYLPASDAPNHLAHEHTKPGSVQLHPSAAWSRVLLLALKRTNMAMLVNF